MGVKLSSFNVTGPEPDISGTTAATLAIGNDDRFLSAAEQDIRVMHSRLTKATGFSPTSGTAYWVYVGRIPVSKIVQHIRAILNTAASGAATIELCVASAAAPGFGVSQNLVKVFADGAVDSDLTTGAPKQFRNNTAFNAATGVIHTWLGFRSAYATTQAIISGLTRYYGNGEICSTAASGALTGAGPWTGTPLSFTTVTAVVGPDLYLTMD